MSRKIRWPDGRAFAFTVFDDTDRATAENIREVYAFLKDLGMFTTKSVWPIRGKETPRIGGATCDDGDYCDFVRRLHAEGFEIGFHNATFHSSCREDTIRGLDTFARYFGHDPATHANHADNAEAIYWGEDRLSGMYRAGYNLLTQFRNRGRFRGHREGDPCFWGDVCKSRIKYVRNFVYSEMNTLRLCPFMPYHDPQRPYVNYWFASSEGPEVGAFNGCVAEAAQDRLEAEGGACIMYTHFAYGFQEGRDLQPRFERLLRRLAGKNGWFVPVSRLLDFLLEHNGRNVITDRERASLERRWLFNKVFRGTS
ncbi:MAG: hypothetical protein HY706_16265 [Candidatus Hydrogenedentes bacterium]|nr:hypothetical protein [Candidatus Hydrogenedentota bacterium]